MRVFWLYTFNDKRVAIWERDESTRREKCIWEDGKKIDDEWTDWHHDTKEEEVKENNYGSIVELSEEEVILEML